MEKQTFDCNGCGACCALVGFAVAFAKKSIESGTTNPLIEEAALFPYAIREDQSCSQLRNDNSCAVYQNRPNICSVDRSFKKYYAHKMSRKKYYETTHKECDRLRIVRDGFDPPPTNPQ